MVLENYIDAAECTGLRRSLHAYTHVAGYGYHTSSKLGSYFAQDKGLNDVVSQFFFPKFNLAVRADQPEWPCMVSAVLAGRRAAGGKGPDYARLCPGGRELA